MGVSIAISIRLGHAKGRGNLKEMSYVGFSGILLCILLMAITAVTIFLLSEKATLGKITINDLQGGTFTISNGGIYGSMLSTPILNPPQTGILGMHNIVERPVVNENEIVIRPIMYLALSYDHRIIDGKEAVSFLKTIKECLE